MTTTTKSSLVAAINEVDAAVKGIKLPDWIGTNTDNKFGGENGSLVD